MIVYVIFLSLVPVLKTFGISVGFYICVSTIYPFYLFCGYALRQGVWRVNRGLGLLFLLIGTAAVVLFTVLKGNGTIKAAGVFYGYSSIFVILQSIGVFTLVWLRGRQNRRTAKRKISRRFRQVRFGD